MVFSEIFIKKPIMTTLIMVAMVLFGIAAYFRLPVSDLPTVDYPVITINVSYPGASPSTMASTVATPLENECMQIPGLQSVISNNTEGQSEIVLTFDLTRNIDLAAPDVQAAISRATNNLPSDLPEPPTYTKTNPSDQPIVYLMVISDTMTAGQLYDYANTIIGKRISILQGVSQVAIWGAKTAVRIQVDPDKLASYEIGIDEVAQAIDSGTVSIPGGSLNGKFRTFSIEPQGQLFKAKDYDELIVTYRNSAPVRLKDIAKCVDSLDNDVVRVMYGSVETQPREGTVIIAAYRQAGANTVAVSKRIRDVANKLRQEIPGSVKLDIFYDRADNIIESVKDVKNTVFIAILLVVLVIFLFLGRVSDTIIPSITLPITIIATFIIMLAAGFSLDNLSLMGITLSVGFLVDDAIVVLENSVRHVESGERPLKAAVKSMGEITGTVVSTSLALITVFIPLVFMGGVVGRNFNAFAMTVIFAITCSTLVALMLTPMMCGRMLVQTSKEKKTKIEIISNKLEGVLKNGYGFLLKWTLKRRAIGVLLWIVCILGTLWMFKILPKTFMPEGDSGAVTGEMVAVQGTSTDLMRGFQDQVNEALLKDPAVEKIISVTGLQPGADQSTGPFFAVLKPLNQRKESIQKVVQRLRMEFATITSGFAYVMAIPSLQLSSGGEGTAAGSKYSYTISGSDEEIVYDSAQKLEQKMKTIPGIVDVQNSVKLDMPKLDVTILRDLASSLGVTAKSIETALALSYAQGKVTTFNTDTDQYDVIVELNKKYSKDPSNLSRLYLSSQNTNNLIPLDTVVDSNETVGPQNASHLNQLTSGTISFSVAAGVPLGNVTKALDAAAQEILPPELSGTFQGEAQEFEDAVKSLSVMLVISIFIMYIILGILYESYVHPFTILTTLPVAAFGGLATLFLFRSELSIYAYIGTFMLLGIVSKNGIMMVDFANQNLEREGMNNFDAIYNACLTRFRPILMTGASTIMGAMPIALGFGADGSARRPLGLIVVGGLVFAQVITLFVTPTIFLFMQDLQDKFLNRFELTRSGSARRGEEA